MADEGYWMAGRTAIVSGGGLSGPHGGVGYAVSLLFARHGGRVAVLDRVPEAAEATVSEIRAAGGEAFPIIGDVTDDEQCRAAVATVQDRYGRLDTLVNNVASGDRAGVLSASPERWYELLTVNLTTAWQLTRHAVPAMTGGGAVVNVSSVAVSRSGPGTVYGVAKAGVENLTRGTASLLGPRGIRVNCVRLGEIWTSFAARNLPPEARESRRLGVALKTEGTGWDAAYAVLFLASDQARWISGQILTVDGGGPHHGPPGQPPRPPRDATEQQEES